MKERGKNFYDNWGNTLKQTLGNCFSNTTITMVGSRADGTFRRKSDLDFKFSFGGGGLSKSAIYDKVIKCFETELRGNRIHGEVVQAIRKGTSGNVVNVTFAQGGKISFALEN